ncbi:hypothetical protein PILCRDRAFT_16011 [Piloderma croceum F 1598]|uniref:Uncharacterized protein n=1 Tax=Piloderma croceum (strain F 1598) TaxID=765440 RepID=A0A0C3B5K9_PILCF|nr:hypothetical protein PILCRDRAFT_16011 [Piloderma croceum F 1598]
MSSIVTVDGVKQNHPILSPTPSPRIRIPSASPTQPTLDTFQFEHRLTSVEKQDPNLERGSMHFIEEYHEHRQPAVDPNASSCTELSAPHYANSKFTIGYIATGGSIFCCARHGFLRSSSQRNPLNI